MKNQIQRAAVKKAYRILKECGNTQRGFEEAWSSLEVLFPSCDLHAAMDSAIKRADKFNN